MKLSNGLILVAAMAMAGCATSRGTMSLNVPPAGTTTTSGTTVFIDQIVDKRVFEDEPSEPSTPSLKGRKGSSESADIKAKAIARKRNTYGRALGDILLDGDQTVVGVMRDLLREGFSGAGYHVVNDRSQLGEGGMNVNVEVEKFWAWFTPGFFSVSMESQIETRLEVTQDGATRDVGIRAYGKNSGQSGREGNWREAYRRAFEDYKTKLEQAFPQK
ncbi:MAG TPA: hypothetical protein VFN25_03675 [Dokdonella sp.]|uniref:hypothetical protein n=1 Tax=Dokdonella sp. TaxID=2291710 RepID=UPI002D7EDF9C|nr:hypothetical protein [Dokdonella sp.]HET9031986.1 hypothetical protein [Dokdonella sp.]